MSKLPEGGATFRQRACPRDHTPLVANKVRVFGPDVTVDNCPKCEGVFLDKNELRRLTGDRELNSFLRDKVGYDSDSTLVCPHCGGIMDVEHAAGVEVDVCLSCFGLWLDKGELAALKARKNAQAIEIDPAKQQELDEAKYQDRVRVAGENKKLGFRKVLNPLDNLLDEIVRRWL